MGSKGWGAEGGADVTGEDLRGRGEGDREGGPWVWTERPAV